MDNQHRKIIGYRELDPADIDLMNTIKAQGGALDTIVRAALVHIAAQRKAATDKSDHLIDHADEQQRLDTAQPERWAAIAKTHFQEGLMALTRAVAQPTFF